LQAQGETFESFRKDVRDQYIVSALRAKNIAQEIVISPNRVGSYYLAHQDDFKVEDEIKLRMIVLNKTSADDTNTVSLAREIRDKIKEGAAFTEMASIYSQDTLVEQTRLAHVKPLADVRDEIEKSLRAQEQSRLEKQWIAKLKAKTFILYF
jgi:hypothetical protein